MAIIHNCWVEKALEKKLNETAPAYKAYEQKNDFKHQTRKTKRFAPFLKTTLIKTLNGLRK